MSFVLSLILSFVLYGNTLKGEFVWDDVFFTERQELTQVSHIPKLFIEAVLPDKQAASLYRPFTMATFSLNLALHGKEPLGFHIVSIVLNALAAWLLLQVVYRLFKDKILAIFSALFFMFLPIHTEAVALMKARDELIGTVLLLLAWLAFLRSTKSEVFSKKWLLLSAAIFFIGILSKEFVIMGPALFYLVYWMQNGIRPIAARVKSLGWGILIYGAFFAAYLFMRHVAIPDTGFGNDDIGPLSNVLVMPERWVAFLTAFKIAFIYISKIIVPIGLTASYHFKAVTLVGSLFVSWKALAGLSLLLLLIAFVLWKKTKKTPLGVGALVFLILYFPVSQLVFIGGDIVGERWMYLASVGMAIIVGWIFTQFFQWRKYVAIACFIVLIGWYTSILIPRNLVWHDSFALFSSMVKDSPNSVRGYSALGQYYFEHGMYPEAIETINKGFSISNQEPNLYVVAASIAYKQGKFSQAEGFIRKALELPTFSTAAVLNFPRILFVQRDYDGALKWYDDFVSQLPPASIKFPEKLLYATILSKTEQYDRSNTYILDELASDIGHHDVGMLMSANYYYLGDTKKALQYFQGEKNQTDQEKIEILKKFNRK